MGKRLPVLKDFVGKECQEPNNIIEWKKVQEWLKTKRAMEREPHTYENENFIGRLEGGIYNMARLRASLRNPTTLLLYLLFWRGNSSGGPNKRCKEWYEKGMIVASQSVEQMARDLQVSESTIKRWIKALSNDMIIIVEKIGLQNVYVLGKVYEDGSEGFYYSGSAIPYRRP